MVIFLDRITHGYGSRMLINHLSLTWEGPGLVLLCGESGSGKTTFLRLLQGVKPLSGTVYIQGLAMHTLTDEEILFVRRNIVSVVHQQPQLLLDTTVKAMILQVMTLKHVRSFPTIWFTTYLHDVRQDQLIRTLSRGQIRRLAVLLATLGPARILMLDEPLDGLDEPHRKRMISLMITLAQTYRVIVATHHSNELPPDTDQLHFPLDSLPVPIQPSLLRSMPLKATRVRAFSWSFLWHYHTRQQRVSSTSHVPLPTFMLVFMTLVFSTTNAMGGFLQQWTHTMLGGDYQWIESLDSPETSLHAPSEADIAQLSDIFLDGRIEKDFDSSFFSQYFPSTIGYLDYQGYKTYIPHFSIETFNDYRYIYDAPIGYQNIRLEEEELILGIEPSQLSMLSKAWGLFPTYHQLDTFVQLHRPLVYFDFEYAPWGYRSQIAFEIVHIVATETLTIFHSMTGYNEHLYSHVLRFPLTPFDQPQSAWFILYTYRIRTDDHSAFLFRFAHDPFFKQWDIQQKNDLYFRLFKHQRSFSVQHPPTPQLINQSMQHSNAGYQFLPDQWMQGFALPILWSKQAQVESTLLDEYIDLSLEQWLSVHPPSHLARSHVYLGAQASITLSSIRPKYPWDYVGISSALALKLKLNVGDELIAHVFYNQQAFAIPLRIDEILEQTNLTLFLAPLRWEMLLIQYLRLGSWSIQPLAYAYYGEETITLHHWRQSTPFQSLQTTFQTLRWLGYLALFILFLLLLLPSFLVFVQTIQLALFDERRALQTMAMIGFSVRDLLTFVDSKLVYQGVRMIAFFGISFFPLEAALQQLWAESFGFVFDYRFPFSSLIFTVGLLFLFYMGMKVYFQHDVLKQIKKLW